MAPRQPAGVAFILRPSTTHTSRTEVLGESEYSLSSLDTLRWEHVILPYFLLKDLGSSDFLCKT